MSWSSFEQQLVNLPLVFQLTAVALVAVPVATAAAIVLMRIVHLIAQRLFPQRTTQPTTE